MYNNSSERIGYETAIGKRRWAGPVVATPDALYCVLAVANSTADLMKIGVGGALGGAIGGIIAGAMTRGSAAAPPTLATIANVPEHLRAADTGPLRKFKADIPVLIVTREAVATIEKQSWINNTLSLQLGAGRVTITHSLFGPSKVRRYLAEAGWPLVWRGKRFNGVEGGSARQ